MLFNLATVLAFVGVSFGLVLLILLLGRVVRPQIPERAKLSPYECGEEPIEKAWFNFNPRFYIIAIAFLIFDVEVAFMYPVAVVLRRTVAIGAGWLAVIEIGVFVAVLALGLAYIWKKGDLEWLKQLPAPAPGEAAPGAAPPAEKVEAK